MVAIAKEFHLGSDFPTIDHATWQKQVERISKARRSPNGWSPTSTKASNCSRSTPRRCFRQPAIRPDCRATQPFMRGAQPLGNVLTGWDIRQEHAHPDPAVANAQILEDLNGGVTSIDLRLDGAARHGLDADDPRAVELTGRDGVSISSVADIGRLAHGVKLGHRRLPSRCRSGVPAGRRPLCRRGEAGRRAVGRFRGGFNADPLKGLVRDGHLPVPLDTALGQMADLAAWTAENAPRMTSVEVSSTPYHNAGATAVADIAFTIATGVEYLRALTDAGLDVETAARQITFSIGSGLPLLPGNRQDPRAPPAVGRCHRCHAAAALQAQKMTLRVSTGRRVLTTRNQSLNILRNTVACYAGAVAGADVITTTPFDTPTGLPTEASRRNARNTQLILAEECHLSRVIDPAGGSWYIEWYTNEVARRAWEMIQQIEARAA